MNKSDRRRAAQQAREARRQLAQNPSILSSADEALRDVQRLDEQVDGLFNGIGMAIERLGGLRHIRETIKLAGQVVADFYASLPPNWPIELDIEQAINLANAGLPIVWVPPGAVLVELAAAPDRNAQMAVLHSHREELHDDMLRTLDQVTHETLAGQVILARRAVETWTAGYHEAAQALAVAVTETIITAHYAGGRGYKQVGKDAAFDLDASDLMAVAELRFLIAVAPISSFYTPWFSATETPPPDALSRHVTVHNAVPVHYNLDNALIAVLLQASLLRAFQDLLAERDLER